MKVLISVALILLCLLSVGAEENSFSNAVKASLLFQDDTTFASGYPHNLKVILRLENIHNSDVFWVANSVMGIEAELLDIRGNPVPSPPSGVSVTSNFNSYLLPYGSRLDWLVSDSGIGMVGDVRDKYALMLGTNGWLIPIASASEYSLRLRLRGLPWTRTALQNGARILPLLLDLPATKLQITQ